MVKIMPYKKGKPLEPITIVKLVFRKKSIIKRINDITNDIWVNTIENSPKKTISEYDLKSIITDSVKEMFIEVLTTLLTQEKIKISWGEVEEQELN